MANMANNVFHAAPYGSYGPLYAQGPKVGDVTHQTHNAQNRNVPKRTHDGEGSLSYAAVPSVTY